MVNHWATLRGETGRTRGADGTLVTLVHEFAVPQADTANPTEGWTAVLDSLAEHPAG